jgi:uncharacterized protein YndB with AHSA1/START domain/DNA-binding transcriptional ArsR family regulator
MNDVFRALADPSRRRLLDSLNESGGQSLRELCHGLDMTRQAVSKHLAVLEASNLVTVIRNGREKLHYLNMAPINDIADRWIDGLHRGRGQALSDLRRALEDDSMSDQRPGFVYTTYIRTSPEKLWQALTLPTFTERYWGVIFDTDWKAGSRLTYKEKGITIDDPDQVVLETDPFRRLAYTWHTFTPEWARVHGLSDELRADLAAEPRSRVSFDLEPVDDQVKLTVVHQGFGSGTTAESMVSNGWPRLLCDLKSLLEASSA